MSGFHLCAAYNPGMYVLAAAGIDFDEHHTALFNFVCDRGLYVCLVDSAAQSALQLSELCWLVPPGMGDGQMSSRCTDSSDFGIFLAVFPCEAGVPCKWASSYSGLAFYFLEKKLLCVHV